MTKTELRKIYLEKRLGLSFSSYEKLNDQLCSVFFRSTDLSRIHVLHSFLPIIKNKEPDTFRIIKRIHKEIPSVSISIPKVNNMTGVLDNVYYEGMEQISQNKWGIPEPQYGEPTRLEDIDVVLVPLLLFDLNGHRIGYGKGYYDRFLAMCKPDCKKIGISFFPATDTVLPIEGHDVRLNKVITPEKEYLF